MHRQLVVLGFALLFGGGVFCQNKEERIKSSVYDPLGINRLPEQPPRSAWKFVQDLQSPYWQKLNWQQRQPSAHEVDFSTGIVLDDRFPDSEQQLERVYEDLRNFCMAAGIRFGLGDFHLVTTLDSNLTGEEFGVKIVDDRAIVSAGTSEGVRRGIFYLQDEMVKNGGPYLTKEAFRRSPHIKRRISRCFFSPIKRPGNQQDLGDELLDTIDYYPDEYLNRLAHEGVNGLWVTVSSKDGNETSVGFADLVYTELTGDPGENGRTRLAKLKKIVEKCDRYGIRVYIKTMEPHVRLHFKDPLLAELPGFAGHRRGDYYYLCASGDVGQKYLYGAVHKIFEAVPKLGGIINISHGELYTSCLSALSPLGGGEISCPNCKNIPEWKILHNSLSAMKKGMVEVNPEAELISWLYIPQPQSQVVGQIDTLADWVYEVSSNTPEGVILQFNFESGVEKEVFGKRLVGGDYWISTPGPSERFIQVANRAVSKGTDVSAKIQTSNSHEVATVPYVPVPSLLYEKFKAMRKLGVSHTMLSWIMGAYPGLMMKAMERLSFSPFPADEEAFLEELASLYWNRNDISKVVKAWQYFSTGYANYPLTNMFQYFGPMHDGTVWPLLLQPQDAPLSPTYQLGSRNTLQPWPPSGDRIGESFTELLSLEEMTELCRRMSVCWDKGIAIFDGLADKYPNDRERQLDIGIARALGIQFRSGYNILRFYLLREQLFRLDPGKRRRRVSFLNQLEQILKEEISNSEQLEKLALQDSRLGFHPEAEGYKYFPEKLRWRVNQLKTVLEKDIPRLREQISINAWLFPAYTGQSPDGEIAYASYLGKRFKNGIEEKLDELRWNKFTRIHRNSDLSWAAAYGADSLYFLLREKPINSQTYIELNTNVLEVQIEPKRLWPTKYFGSSILLSDEKGSASYRVMSIPLERIFTNRKAINPLRVNIKLRDGRGGISSWLPTHPATPRLILGSENSADLGWLLFDDR